MKSNKKPLTSEVESLAAGVICVIELEQIAREGAQKMLQVALQLEVEQYIEHHAGQRDDHGKRLVVRNGALPGRELQTGLGPISVRQPRGNDRREGRQFTSAILPPYLRRVASIENLIPALYLKVVSTGEMSLALESILGPKAAGLSPAQGRLAQGTQGAGGTGPGRQFTTSTCGPTESTSRFAWEATGPACWCWSARCPMAPRKWWPSTMARGKAGSPDGRCCAI